MKKAVIGVFILALAAWLFVPAGAPATSPPAGARPFIWDQDRLWQTLEESFVATRSVGCPSVSESIDEQLSALSDDVAWLAEAERPHTDGRLDAIERNLFAVAPLVAACPEHLTPMLDVVTRLRTEVKRSTRNWDIRDAGARDRVYRLLFGARMAIEEVLLQSDSADVPDLILGTDVPSQTPSVAVNGLRVHSGDILVSRGGAPVSALIARGNDYPGNFSHIALLHVSEQQEVSVIEAHIEVGVTVSTLEQYLADKKLRLMVLRLDNSLPALQADPLLPHRAATAALGEARERHVPYDFAMYYEDPGKKFCSEVASSVYSDQGVVLWEGLTTMSAGGTTAWLSALGVEQFVTYGPSDLEYDPKMVVVAEWRDPEALFDDHVDNAVIDAMLEGAERGDIIDYHYRYLPMARLMKAYSALLNTMGKHGPVPEGMGATTALRSKWLDDRHAAIKAEVLAAAGTFQADHKYTPPYWQLLEMARAQVGVTATQAESGTPAPLQLTSEQAHAMMRERLGIGELRPGANPNATEPGDAPNYDESKAWRYRDLPDPLVNNDGQLVLDASAWLARRAELVALFENEMYGRIPANAPDVEWVLVEEKEQTRGDVDVIVRILRGRIDNRDYPLIQASIDLTLVVPVAATEAVPVMLHFGWPPEILARFPAPPGPSWEEQVLEHGWAAATIVPTSFQADDGAGLTNGVIGITTRGQLREPEDWGTLRAWAWGASRALDYFEHDVLVDASRAGIEGLSRYGKAALVTMAFDERFAIGFIGSSGAGGAKLLRRDFGERVENLAWQGQHHWMSGSFLKYAGPLEWDDLPVDAHELIALVAPRPVFISAGAADVEGQWIDQRGMFEAAVAAGPVYELLGKRGLPTHTYPPAGTALVDGDIAWRQHHGGHTTLPNWPVFLEWADHYLAGTEESAL